MVHFTSQTLHDKLHCISPADGAEELRQRGGGARAVRRQQILAGTTQSGLSTLPMAHVREKDMVFISFECTVGHDRGCEHPVATINVVDTVVLVAGTTHQIAAQKQSCDVLCWR